MARYIDPDTGAVIEVNPPPEPAGPGGSLSAVFKGGPEKTLKLQLKDGVSFINGVKEAYHYVSKPTSTHNRVEFKFGNCYFVVARLKEEGQ